MILNRIFVHHTKDMDAEQREKYEAELYGWGEEEADALAAVMDAALQADDEGVE